MKFGIWLLVAAVAYLWFQLTKRQRVRATARAAAAQSPAGHAPVHPKVIEHIVACAHCGLHVPVSDASLSEDGAIFCSESHRRLHRTA